MANLTTGEFLAVMRRAKGLTQREAAEKLNVSDKTVSSWETDRTAPDLTLLPTLADLYGVTVDEILRGGIAPADGRIADGGTAKLKREYNSKLLKKLLWVFIPALIMLIATVVLLIAQPKTELCGTIYKADTFASVKQYIQTFVSNGKSGVPEGEYKLTFPTDYAYNERIRLEGNFYGIKRLDGTWDIVYKSGEENLYFSGFEVLYPSVVTGETIVNLRFNRLADDFFKSDKRIYVTKTEKTYAVEKYEKLNIANVAVMVFIGVLAVSYAVYFTVFAIKRKK